MTDLHARLLAELDHARRARGRDEMVAALRAVVELHAPVAPYEGAETRRCRGCDKPRTARRPPWPCSTIQAIARELGVATEGDDRG